MEVQLAEDSKPEDSRWEVHEDVGWPVHDGRLFLQAQLPDCFHLAVQ